MEALLSGTSQSQQDVATVVVTVFYRRAQDFFQGDIHVPVFILLAQGAPCIGTQVGFFQEDTLVETEFAFVHLVEHSQCDREFENALHREKIAGMIVRLFAPVGVFDDDADFGMVGCNDGVDLFLQGLCHTD